VTGFKNSVQRNVKVKIFLHCNLLVIEFNTEIWCLLLH